MLELVVTVCLLAHAETCHIERLPSSGTSVASCLYKAQPQLARWSARHPKWLVRNYHCSIAGSEREA